MQSAAKDAKAASNQLAKVLPWIERSPLSKQLYDEWSSITAAVLAELEEKSR